MISRNMVVREENGIGIEQASIVAHEAEKCSSVVEICYKNHIVNAKSLLNILSVSIAGGSWIEIRCTGPAEQEDLEHMVRVFSTL